MDDIDAPLRVGIVPAHQHRVRARLWAALEDAYPVRFEGRDDVGATRGLDAVVVLGTGDTSAIGIPRLTLHGEETPGGQPRPLALAADSMLARPLRGARLSDGHADALQEVRPGEVVLATLDGAPMWVSEPVPGSLNERVADPLSERLTSPLNQRVASAPAELGAGEALRERLRPGRCLALLALAHFLAQITAHLRPSPPPLRAAFLIDDPNLHRPYYGHLDYAALLRHARLHGYHLAVAMVPLDARFAHPRAVRLFREGAAHISLCIHGNDHDGPELGRPRRKTEAMGLVAQALRRTVAFERRTAVAVDRVMVPPHERVSEPVARALYACGFQALTTTRPYPWLADTPQRSWLARPDAVGPLAAWGPVDVVAGGLQVLLRAEFDHPREDLVLRAFLGQPLILYGHHDLLAQGPDALAQAAAEIDRLGDVRWCSLGAIARAHACARGTRAETGSTHAVVEARQAGTGATNGRPAPPAVLDHAAIDAIHAPPLRLAPLVRRLASEGRDRARALRPVRRRAAARGARPTSWSART
jgi:hypothetical protein